MRQFMKGLLVFGVEIEVKQTLFDAGGTLSIAGVVDESPLYGVVAVFSLSLSPSSSSEDMPPKSSRTGRRSLVDVGLSSSRGLFSDCAGGTTCDEDGAELDSVWLKSLGLRSAAAVASLSAVASK